MLTLTQRLDFTICRIIFSSQIPNSCEGKAWYTYVDDAVTPDILKKLTDEYLGILEKSPSKFKSKMKTLASNGQAGVSRSYASDRVPSNRLMFSLRLIKIRR